MSLAKDDVSCSSLDNDDCTVVQSPHTWAAGAATSGNAVTEDLPLMERLGRKKFVDLYFLTVLSAVGSYFNPLDTGYFFSCCQPWPEYFGHKT